MGIEIHVGATDIRWIVFALIAALATSWLVRGRALRRLERKQRVLMLLLEREAATRALRRYGPEVGVDDQFIDELSQSIPLVSRADERASGPERT